MVKRRRSTKPSNVFDELMVEHYVQEVEKNRIKVGFTEVGQEVEFGLKQMGHTLISGISRSGKTQLALHLLESVTKFADVAVYSLKPSDFFMFRDVVRLYEDQDVICDVLRRTAGEIERRAERVRKKSEKAGRVVQCDERPMIIMLDEYATLSEEMDQATEIAVQKIANVGAGLNVFLYIITQVPYKKTLKGTLRDNMMTDIAFKQRDARGSMMAVGSHQAMLLPLRHAIVRNVDRTFKITHLTE